MSPRLKLKHPGQEYRLIRQRVLFAGLVMFLLALTLLVRVFFLQVVMHDHFTTLSRNNRVKIVPISPIRGDSIRKPRQPACAPFSNRSTGS